MAEASQYTEINILTLLLNFVVNYHKTNCNVPNKKGSIFARFTSLEECKIVDVEEPPLVKVDMSKIMECVAIGNKGAFNGMLKEYGINSSDEIFNSLWNTMEQQYMDGELDQLNKNILTSNVIGNKGKAHFSKLYKQKLSEM
eukprot:523733_1